MPFIVSIVLLAFIVAALGGGGLILARGSSVDPDSAHFDSWSWSKRIVFLEREMRRTC